MCTILMLVASNQTNPNTIWLRRKDTRLSLRVFILFKILPLTPCSALSKKLPATAGATALAATASSPAK